MNKYLNEIVTAFLILIEGAAVLKIIKILMDGQANDVPIKESLQKAKKVLMAAIICLVIGSLINVIRSYF